MRRREIQKSRPEDFNLLNPLSSEDARGEKLPKTQKRKFQSQKEKVRSFPSFEESNDRNKKVGKRDSAENENAGGDNQEENNQNEEWNSMSHGKRRKENLAYSENLNQNDQQTRNEHSLKRSEGNNSKFL